MATVFLNSDDVVAEEIVDGACEDTSWKQAPKKIVSKDIVKFFVRFAWNDSVGHSQNGFFIPDPYQPYPQGIWSMSLIKTKNGARFTIHCEQNDLQITGEVPQTELVALQKLIDEHHLAELNGHSKRDSALDEVLDLTVTYASGESITAYAMGGSATLPDNWSPLWFLDFFAHMAKKAGLWPKTVQ